jgi:hypothetical protein
MPRDNEHNPDPNVNASRIVRESTASDGLPDDTFPASATPQGLAPAVSSMAS